MAAKFEIIDHTADIGMIIRGDSLKELFENAATGMFSMITDIDKVKLAVKKKIRISSSDRESLLIDWLNELLYLFEAEFYVFGKFEILKLDDKSLQAVCHGEKIAVKHEIKREVKAATYHMLNLSKEDKGYQARVIFDI